MTRYSSRWKKQENGNKRQNLLAAFITIVLILALIWGVAKGISFGKLLGSSTWDGTSSISAVLNTDPPSILVYQSYPKHLVLLTLDEGANFATGSVSGPVRTIGSVFEGTSGIEMKTTVSKIAHAPISNYVLLSNSIKMDKIGFSNQFKQFASITSPFKILISGAFLRMRGNQAANTDFTRKDLFRLWWQVKSMRVDDVEVITTGNLHEEIVLLGGKTVLGIDDVSFNALLAKYLENRNILEDKEKIVVVNGSGVVGAGKLAADFVSAVGGSVDKVETGESTRQKTTIVAQKSYTSNYLAKLFECDITNVPNMQKDQIEIILGRDFAQKYSL